MVIRQIWRFAGSIGLWTVLVLLAGGSLARLRAEGEGAAPVQTTGGYTLVSGTVVNGAGTSSGGTEGGGGMSLTGMVGQPVAGGGSGGGYTAQAGGSPATIMAIGLEGDVSPRSLGSGGMNASDWVQIGRFVLGLDAITSVSEYQRVDCAPQSSLGDGQIFVSDWVQAGRYVIGLDTVVSAGGPTQAVSVSGTAPADSSEVRELRLGMAGDLLGAARGGAGESGVIEVPVMLAARGEENALSLSVGFDAGRLAYAGARPGRDTGSDRDLLVNERRAGEGVIGLGLRLAVDAAFTPGDREVVVLRFRRIGTGDGGIRLVAGPAPLGLASRLGVELPVRISGAGYRAPAIAFN